MTLTRLPSNSINGLRLGTFIIVSIAAHWLLLAGAPQNSPAYPATAASISVTVVSTPQRTSDNIEDTADTSNTSSQPVEPPPFKPDTDAQASTQPTHRPEPAKDIVATATPMTKKPPPQITNSTQTAAARKNPAHNQIAAEPKTTSAGVPTTALEKAEKPAFTLAQAKEQIRQQLHNDLGRHFYYPYIAQRRGWEGMVLLDLMIDTNGNISRISVAQSSGYNLLDNSAIETLNKVGNINEAGRWLQGRSLELQLPVIYRLTNS